MKNFKIKKTENKYDKVVERHRRIQFLALLGISFAGLLISYCTIPATQVEKYLLIFILCASLLIALIAEIGLFANLLSYLFHIKEQRKSENL